ncbi:SRPBCC family protein [Synechococcus sp. PCC 7336]|uniref:SRPBCC family protein n=1 Tax=Synechococcus sp. PCC 7336 TaxID=195250 RepID=UPI00034BEC05|nr:SRPBCC family protein [Synechococcus sp. PCC 7336]
MADHWLEHTCQIQVPASIDRVWSLWSNLEQLPRWMKWISSVQTLDGDLSRWTLSSRGFTFNWTSKTHTVIHQQRIEWESVDGLHNRGCLRFYDRKADGTIVRLSIAYSVPGWLAAILQIPFIDRIVESTLQADLERFKAFAIANP